MNTPITPYRYLPLFVRVAIERLDSDRALRTARQLDDMIDAYAKTYGTTCEPPDRASAHHICACRFGDSFKPADSTQADHDFFQEITS